MVLNVEEDEKYVQFVKMRENVIKIPQPFWLENGIDETTTPGLLCIRLDVFDGSCALLGLGMLK